MKLKGVPIAAVLPVITSLCPLLLHAASAPQYSPTVTEDGVDANLAALLQRSSAQVQKQGTISDALRILYVEQSAPPCNRLAAVNLINDCKSLDLPDAKVDSGDVLELVKSEYAARLAVCELSGAKGSVSKECKILLPNPKACSKGRFRSLFTQQETTAEPCYPDYSRMQLQLCLKALNDQGQSWTSYSNAKQNAITICHASREDIEREKTLSLHRNLDEAVNYFVSKHEESAQQMQALMEQVQTWMEEHLAFAEHVRTSENAARQEMEENRNSALSAIETFKNTFISFAESIPHQVEESLERSIKEVQAQHEELHKELALSTTQYSARQRQEVEIAYRRGHELAEAHLAAIKHSHQEIKESHQEYHRSVAASSADYARLAADIIEKLSHANKSLDSIGPKFEEFYAGMTQAVHLVDTLRNPNAWLAAIAMILCLVGAWWMNRKFAGYLFFACGCLILLYLADPYRKLVISKRAIDSFYATLHPVVQILFGIAIAYPLTFGFWKSLESLYLYHYRDERGENGVILNVETPAAPVAPPPQEQHGFNLFEALRCFY